MFNFQSKKSIVGVLTLSTTLALAGCESMSNSGSSNVDSRLTSGNQAEFFSKSGLTACAAGAAAGVWAMLLPHDVSELVLEDKGVAYVRYRGQKQPARLGAGSLIVPRWACLSWQLEGGGSVAQVLLPDRLSAEDWRFFYVWAQLWQKD